jgi:hypothetical protein
MPSSRRSERRSTLIRFLQGGDAKEPQWVVELAAWQHLLTHTTPPFFQLFSAFDHRNFWPNEYPFSRRLGWYPEQRIRGPIVYWGDIHLPRNESLTRAHSTCWEYHTSIHWKERNGATSTSTTTENGGRCGDCWPLTCCPFQFSKLVVKFLRISSNTLVMKAEHALEGRLWGLWVSQ